MLLASCLSFASSKHSYLYNPWNLLDFFLVMTSWAFVIVSLVSDKELLNPSILRVLRTLRPLRTAAFITSVKAAMGYWRHLLNILLLTVFALGLFGILGIQVRTVEC